MISIVIILGILFLFGYGIYRVNETKKQIELLQEAKFVNNEIAAEEMKKLKPEPKPVYQFQTHRMRYLLYNPCWDLEYLAPLYKDVILENLWINEPFHSKFYEILILLDHNEFMIIDPNSKVISMNIRDKNNRVHASKSYQVFATKDIVKAIIRESMRDILKFQKHDAQHILLAICIMALERSVHYTSQEVVKNTFKELFKDYQYVNDIEYIIELIKQKEQKLLFVQSAFKGAFSTTKTEPYNDSEVSKPLQIQKELPTKYLQEI